MSASKRKGKQRRARLEAQKSRGRDAPSRPPAMRDAAGRVHLVVHKDPSSGSAFFGLAAPLFRESWQNDVAAATANTAYATLRAGVDLERAVAVVRHLMTSTSKLADGFLARAANGTVACKPGCDHCCHQSVGVTTAEALAIVDHLRKTFSDEALVALTQRVAAAHERARGLSTEDRYSPEQPCPFLESSRCSIYEARPLACRGMNSLDAEECAQDLREPSARAAFLAGGAGGRSFLEPIRAFHAISAGMQLSFSELFHLDMLPLDLTLAMHQLLCEGDAEAIAADWLGGNSPLEAARGGDSTHHPRIRELSGRALGANRRPE